MGERELDGLIIMIEERIAGPLPQSRLTGAMTGLRGIIRSVAGVVQFDGKGVRTGL